MCFCYSYSYSVAFQHGADIASLVLFERLILALISSLKRLHCEILTLFAELQFGLFVEQVATFYFPIYLIKIYNVFH